MHPNTTHQLANILIADREREARAALRAYRLDAAPRVDVSASALGVGVQRARRSVSALTGRLLRMAARASSSQSGAIEVADPT